jgi:geranylgeranyl transferase type-2 subunit alpha
MCTFDPDHAAKGMAPNLSTEERLRYLAGERDYIEELLEDSQDCKWAYQALIECLLMEAKLKNGLQQEDRTRLQGWLNALQTLDPLRNGRWSDMERSILDPQ